MEGGASMSSLSDQENLSKIQNISARVFSARPNKIILFIYLMLVFKSDDIEFHKKIKLFP